MRIPKRVNTVLDRMEQHYLALGVVVALVLVALVAVVVPSRVGLPIAAFILGAAIGGFTMHVRSSRRVARARAEVDNLLRENGALRHRNTVLASGVITREAQETQALVAIPEDDLLDLQEYKETQSTVTLDELLDGDPQTTDELPEEPEAMESEAVESEAAESEAAEDGGEDAESTGDGAGTGAGPARDDDPQRTTVLTELPDGLFGEDDTDTAKNSRRG